MLLKGVADVMKKKIKMTHARAQEKGAHGVQISR